MLPNLIGGGVLGRGCKSDTESSAEFNLIGLLVLNRANPNGVYNVRRLLALQIVGS